MEASQHATRSSMDDVFLEMSTADHMLCPLDAASMRLKGTCKVDIEQYTNGNRYS